MSVEKEVAMHVGVTGSDSSDHEAGGGLEYEKRIM